MNTQITNLQELLLKCSSYDEQEIINKADEKTREEYSLENEPLQLWEGYYKGDADFNALLEVAKQKRIEGNSDEEKVYELLKHMDKTFESYLLDELNNFASKPIFKVQDSIGRVRVKGLTLSDALAKIEEYEQRDREDGGYMPDFYEIR